MTQAVGRLVESGSARELGTVFAVTRSLALTTFHGLSSDGDPVDRVRCLWPIGISDASLLDYDEPNDVALLAFDRILPRRLDPIALTDNVPTQTEFIAPGAPGELGDLPLVAMSGQIIWAEGVLPNWAPGIQLACRESAAGLSLHGFSGAPVLTGNLQKAIGVIRWNPPSVVNPDRASGSIVYAAPSSEIMRRWPQLRHGIDLVTLIDRLTNHDNQRSTIAVSGDIKALLTSSGLGIDEDDLTAFPTQGSEHGLIVVDSGQLIIRIVRKFNVPTTVAVAKQDLSDAVAVRSDQTRQRYAGIITDGLQWWLYQRLGQELCLTDQKTANPRDPEDLRDWLEAILATGGNIAPTQYALERKLGSDSPSYKLDAAELTAIYKASCHLPTVKIKRRMWAKLLTTASGVSFADRDTLFINHTLLVAMAKLIGHAVLRIPVDNAQVSGSVLMSGEQFIEMGIRGVIESDFFDWITEVPDGEQFIMNLARRLGRFDWGNVYRDVMKHLYESIISRDTRHQLGEYYTPDWLAERILADSFVDPIHQRTLDPSCGSGTFLFYAVRTYLAEADSLGWDNTRVINGLVQSVVGIDVHPVAVTLARVTYLLAIGSDRLTEKGRPNFSVPVYLGDSMRWGQESDLTIDTYSGLSIPTRLDPESFVTGPSPVGWSAFDKQLNFPDAVVADAERFDELVASLADLTTKERVFRSGAALSAIFTRFNIREADRTDLNQTFERMCELHDDELDHIWGYYVRNVARPVWLTRPDNQVDLLVGNPPWLVQRHMTRPQQESFRTMSVTRELWAGGTLATNQDLAGLFVTRCIELYLKPGGHFGYVMPQSLLASEEEDVGAYAGFRTGHYPTLMGPVDVAFEESWDLSDVKPAFFPMPASVVFGRRQEGHHRAVPLPRERWEWSGYFDTLYASWARASPHITRVWSEGPPVLRRGVSPYKVRFFQGANFVPYFLFNVTPDEAPLGSGGNQILVRSRRSANEKMPWRGCEPLTGMVEREFIRALYTGKSVMPFRTLPPSAQVVIPLERDRLLDLEAGDLEIYPGLAKWWRKAEGVWKQHQKGDDFSLLDQVDYRGKLTKQLSTTGPRVVYGGSGMYMAATIVSEPDAIIEHQLYWGLAANLDEARYLTAVLNSSVVTMGIRHLQRKGEQNPRHVGKKVFSLPIPMFDAEDASHIRLVALANQAEEITWATQLPETRFELQRKFVRETLKSDGVMSDIDEIVEALLELGF